MAKDLGQVSRTGWLSSLWKLTSASLAILSLQQPTLYRPAALGSRARGGAAALMRYEVIQEAAEQCDAAGDGDVCQNRPDADTARVLH
jgi:hypothetical protein